MRSGRGLGLELAGVASVMLAMTSACVGDDPILTGGGGADSDAGTDSGSTTDDGGALVPDAAPPANCPLNCLPPAPAGWTGPSAIYDGPAADEPTECPPQYNLAEVSAKRGFTVAATTCECGTPSFAGGSCKYTVTDYTSAGCVNGNNTDFNALTGCYQYGIGGVSGVSVKVINPVFVNAGTCTFPQPVATKPEPVPGTATKACGVPQTASCSAERPDCVATPIPAAAAYARLCIHKAGDEACPSADYAVKIVSYLDVTDDRACSPCTGLVTGSTCPSTFSCSNSASCDAPTGNAGNVGSSTSATCYSAQGSRLVLGYPNVSCNAQTNGVPSGSVQPASPVTFCCAK